MSRRYFAILKLAVLGAACIGANAFAEEEYCKLGPNSLSGTLTANATTIGFMAGVRWGKGTITLNDGTKVNFHFKGLKAMESGASVREIEGEVYNLKNVEDLIGVFYGGSKQLTAGAGKGEAIVNNSKCVVIKARSKSEGIQLSGPSAGGVYVQLAP